MTFKDAATADLSTFLNVDEFADTVNIDGDEVACVLEGNGDTDGSQEGVIDRDIVLRAKASSFYKVPTVGQRMVLDGEPADVVGASEEQGMLEIRLRWLDS